MKTHDEYIDVIEKRFSHLRNESYEMMGYYDWLLLAPASYCVEAAMLAYVKSHPNADMKELCNYFDQIAPDGLAPGDDGADLWEDD